MSEEKTVLANENIPFDQKSVETLTNAMVKLRKKHKRNLCRYCSADIEFRQAPDSSEFVPYDKDGTPHWKTCLAGKYMQKKLALKMVQKFGVYFLLKHGLDLEKELNFTAEESKAMQYILERTLRESEVEIKNDPGKIEPKPTDNDIKEALHHIEEENAELKVEKQQIKGDDPIGDPDEDLSVSEEKIKEIKDPKIV